MVVQKCCTSSVKAPYSMVNFKVAVLSISSFRLGRHSPEPADKNRCDYPNSRLIMSDIFDMFLVYKHYEICVKYNTQRTHP